MRTEEIKIYKFSELSKEVKQEVIDTWYEKYEDYPFLYEDIKEWIISAENYCFDKNIKLQYSFSLSWLQGDGLSFSGELDLEKFLRTVYSKKLKKSVIRALNELIYKVNSKGDIGRYCYASKSDIEFEYNYAENYPRLEKLFETEILPEIQEYYMSLCQDAEKYGYDILEYRMDIQEFEEHAEANSYEYYSDGRMYP